MDQAATDSLAVTQKLIVGVDMAKTEFAAGSVWHDQYTYQGKQSRDRAADLDNAERSGYILLWR